MKRTILNILLVFLINVSCAQNTTHSSINTQDTSKNTIKEKKYNFPKPIGFVNDFVHIFNEQQVEALTLLITDFEQETTNQIAIVTLNEQELTDENFDDYAIELSKYWGVGQKDKNNGLTILLSTELRRIRITTGLGTEKILTDRICQNVLDQIILPEFKKGDYYKGIDLGTKELIKLWK